MDRVGRAVAAHPWRVIAVWLASVVGVAVLSRGVGSRFVDRPTIPGSQSERAAALVRERFAELAGASARVVVRARAGRIDEPAAAAELGELLAALRALPHVREVTEPMLSPDRRVALAELRYDAEPADVPEALDGLLAIARAHRSSNDVAFGGELVSLQTPAHAGLAELCGLVAALVVLLVAFRSVVAAVLPIGMAILSVGLGTALVGALGTRVEISKLAPLLATMLGLGVGVDYALFLVTRFRQELSDGHGVAESVARTSATAGRAVAFAGLTVIVAILGLAFAGVPFVGWMGVAVAIVVAVAVAAATTLLPAVLALLGQRIDALRTPLLARGDSERRWSRWAALVTRRPLASVAAGVALLGGLALPLLDLRLGVLDDANAPEGTTQRLAHAWISDAFGPGANCPLAIVVAAAPGRASEVARRASATIAVEPEVAAVLPVRANPDESLAVVAILPRTAQQDPATSRLVHRLRDAVLPPLARDAGANIALGGLTSLTIDLDEAVGTHLVSVVVAVLVASFALLLVVFRSLLVPLKAVLLNVLSIGASYGVVVMVFQYGVGARLIGLPGATPIISFLPLLMFAILFGLSMDYEVFVLTRVREEHERGASTAESARRGLASTARVVTSAALIMICVFVAFVLGGDPVLKMFGVGLAAAVALDATIVRLVLVPATMVLLGDANWWFPCLIRRRAKLGQSDSRSADRR